MRDTDPPAPPFKPLGEPVPRKPTQPIAPSVAPPRGDYGIVIGEDGKFRTTKTPYGVLL